MTIDVVGSAMKAKNAYGQNGYQGPSSDLPGQHTQVGGGFGPGDAQASTKNPGDWQTRVVTAKQDVPTHPGMAAKRPIETIPTHNVRRASNMK